MKLFNIYKSILIIVCVLIQFGCSVPAKHTQMTVKCNEYSEPLKNSTFVNNVALVEVTGGRNTLPFFHSQVDDQGYPEAIAASLSNIIRIPKKHVFNCLQT
jgi:hypothetical protein